MEPPFWIERWRNNQIGFHQKDTNPFLIRHLNKLQRNHPKKILIPLCGKTLDISYLLEQGFQVIGVELSDKAVGQLFDQIGQSPQITDVSKTNNTPIIRQQIDGLTIFHANIFDLTADEIGNVDAIYDRAALVALPAEMRKRYTQHLLQLTGPVPQLLLTFEYDQTQIDGPPFSISTSEIENHYQRSYTIKKLESVPLEPGIKGKVKATENVWLLEPK